MDAWVTTLVLGSALLHAAWNALIKGGRDRLVTMCAITAVSCGLGLAGALGLPPPAPASWPFLLASVLIHVAYRSFLLGAYRVGDLSHVYPVARGTGPLLVALVGTPLAGEVLGPLEWAGVLAVSAGIFVLARRRGFSLRRDGAPLAWALGTGVIIAAYTVADGLGVRRSGSPGGYIAWLFFLDGVPWLLGLLALALRQPRRLRPGTLRNGLLGGVASTAAYGLVVWALSLGALAPVAALRETSVIFAAFIGTLWLGESFGRTRVAAAVLVAAGVMLLQTGG